LGINKKMSRDSLRDKQNMEMLDVWKHLNSQVFGREKRQIAVFPESVKPKTQRDLGVEVNVDKSIDLIQKTLETKLGALEFLVQNLEQANAGVVAFSGLTTASTALQTAQAFENITNTGDVLPLWNQIVRFYQTQGLSKQSQEMVKVKLQDLKGNLDAIQYGIKGAIDFIFQYKTTIGAEGGINAGQALKILELIRTLSVYKLIAQQTNAGSPELISTASLDSAYKNSFEMLSQNEIAILRRVAPRGSVVTRSIRNIPDFDTADLSSRIKQIQEELGIRFSDADYRRLRRLPRERLEMELDQLSRNTKGQRSAYSAEQKRDLASIEEKASQIRSFQLQVDMVAETVQDLEEEIERLRRDPLDIAEYKQEEEPEEKIEPTAPERAGYEDGDVGDALYEQAMIAYNEEHEQWEQGMVERMRIIAQNRFNREEAEAESREQREELIAVKEQMLLEASNAYDELRREIGEKSDEIDETEAKIARDTTANRDTMLATARVITANIPVRAMKDTVEQYIEDHPRGMGVNRFGRGKPSGKPVDTRGLASMRLNYGKDEMSASDSDDSESESDSDEDPLDFDDRRNEHYYSRPHK
jgi:hypothetical protein